MLVISSREFRSNQKKYFDLLDDKVQIVVQWGKDKSYLLTPLSEADALSVNPELINLIKAAEKKISEGKYKVLDPSKSIWENIG
ncbi:type II toxin-antitoxin system Phd/YefM family antitoxin [Dyadobacter sp. NIV53]|uniref:type II toxin-antitoxin system Phd/YefM family antitoxin n=1 Tax=Dyadobacter sp. NIV53 TaxID=2861765 RepID=UPI001C87524E|nr:type II toxin-antitoxin system Phd/YefM family antitoxin [Dyadobacter sp. NIV53]